jgi:hypothetical protein
MAADPPKWSSKIKNINFFPAYIFKNFIMPTCREFYADNFKKNFELISWLLTPPNGHLGFRV